MSRRIVESLHSEGGQVGAVRGPDREPHYVFEGIPQENMHPFDHLKSLWTNFTLVSALIVSASMTALNSPQSSFPAESHEYYSWYGTLWGICLMINIEALVMASVGLGLVLRKRDAQEVKEAFGGEFVRTGRFNKRDYLVYLPSWFTVAGAFLFVAASIMTTWLRFGIEAGIICVCVCAGMLTIAGVQIYVVLGHVR